MVFSLMLTIDAVTMLRKRHSKSEVALLPTLFLQAPFLKFWQFFLGLNFKRMYWRAGKEKESRCLVFIPLPPDKTFTGLPFSYTINWKRILNFWYYLLFSTRRFFQAWVRILTTEFVRHFEFEESQLQKLLVRYLKYKGNVLTSLFQLGIRI